MTDRTDKIRQFGLAVLVHLLLIATWHFFVVYGKVPKFVMPSPADTFASLFNGDYAWGRNIAVTAGEIFGGYALAVVLGVITALMFSWSRLLEHIFQPLLVSLNMIPKVALGPLIIVWFSYGVLPNSLIAFSIAFFPIVLTTARGLREVEPDPLDLVRALRGSRWQIFVSTSSLEMSASSPQ